MQEYAFPFCNNPIKLLILAEKQQMHNFNGQVDQKAIFSFTFFLSSQYW